MNTKTLTKYAIFDENGFVTSFYDSLINDIPKAATPLTDEQYQELVDNQNTRKFSNGEIVTGTKPVLISWDNIRLQRKALFQETDWAFYTDSPMAEEKKQKLAEYRQKLRDITKDFENPEDVVWPEMP